MKAICCCFVSLVAVVASATIFVSPKDKPPADGAAAVFERPFTNGRAVRRATWAVTAQGVFEAFANGRRVGDDFLKLGSCSASYRSDFGEIRSAWQYDVKKRGKSPGFMFNCGRAGKRREDLGVYNPDFGQWTFYAATRGADGTVRFYQGRRDGYLYCVADDLSDIAFDTGMPFCIGQDGRGVAEYTFVGDVDEFAIWTRTLANEEVRRIYDAGLAGKELR